MIDGCISSRDTRRSQHQHRHQHRRGETAIVVGQFCFLSRLAERRSWATPIHPAHTLALPLLSLSRPLGPAPALQVRARGGATCNASPGRAHGHTSVVHPMGLPISLLG